MGRLWVERSEERIDTFHARRERVVAALLVEQKRRLALVRLRGQRASQRGVVDEFRVKDLEQIAVEALDFPEGPRIAPSEVLPERLEHDVAARVERMDSSHVRRKHQPPWNVKVRSGPSPAD